MAAITLSILKIQGSKQTMANWFLTKSMVLKEVKLSTLISTTTTPLRIPHPTLPTFCDALVLLKWTTPTLPTLSMTRLVTSLWTQGFSNTKTKGKTVAESILSVSKEKRCYLKRDQIWLTKIWTHLNLSRLCRCTPQRFALTKENEAQGDD